MVQTVVVAEAVLLAPRLVFGALILALEETAGAALQNIPSWHALFHRLLVQMWLLFDERAEVAQRKIADLAGRVKKRAYKNHCVFFHLGTVHGVEHMHDSVEWC